MRASRIAPAILLGLTLTVPALAQVYQSKDADGNPVFSDTPTPGAEAIKLDEANVADSVEVPERTEPAPAAAPAAAAPSSDEAPADLNDHLIVNNNDNDRKTPRDVRPKPGHLPAGPSRPSVRPSGGGKR